MLPLFGRLHFKARMKFHARASLIFRHLFDDTPRNNAVKLRRALKQFMKPGRSKTSRGSNQVMDDLLESPCLPQLFIHAAGRLEGPLILAGERAAFTATLERFHAKGRAVEFRELQWGTAASLFEPKPDGRVILCLLPVTAQDWQEVAALKAGLGDRLLLLTELLLPYSCLTFLQRRLDYYFTNLDQILPYYFGEKFFGPLDRLNEIFPLGGKSVIEFGPFEGCQTAGLIHLGAASVTCIEARAENATKTRTLAELLGWVQVRVIMDDFHNADSGKYGRYDLAFAHGVYYHAIAPFVFLENLASLSDAVFLGGFCATDESPASAWLKLERDGRTYRVKQYREVHNFTAGVNPVAYFFHGDDLIRFFTERGRRVTIISDETPKVTAGRFLRFLAIR